MGSLQVGTETTGIGAEMYKWAVETLFLTGPRGYRRLNAPVKRKRVRLARLGKQRSRAAKPLKIRRLKVRLSWFSPFTLLAKLRDSYVNLLQAASNKLALSEGLSPFSGPPCEFGRGGRSSFKAHERELDKFLELYLARTRPQLLTNSP